MPRFLMSVTSAQCGHQAPGKLEGNAYAGPANLKISCSVCGQPGVIDSYQTIDRLPMNYGDHKSFYDVSVGAGNMVLALRPNCPIFKEVMHVDWPDDLDGNPGEVMLPRLEEAVADLEQHPDKYRAMNDHDWFGYDGVLGFLKQVIPVAKANPKVPVQFRLEIGGAG